MFEQLNSPTDVYNHQRKDSNEAGEQLVAWKAENQGHYEPCIDHVTGLMVRTVYDSEIALCHFPAIIMAHVKPRGINYSMSVNLFATNAVKTAQMLSWWHEEIARIDPAQRNSDPPCAYISVVNQSSQQLCSTVRLCISLSQWFLAPVPQWHTTPRLRLTLFTDFVQCHLQRTREW